MSTMYERRWLVLAVGICSTGGCVSGGRLDLAAADAVDALAAHMSTAVEEYHADLHEADDARTAEVIAAFVARLQSCAGDDAAVAAHTADFQAALQRLQADRATALRRYHVAQNDAATAREVAVGLRRAAMDRMSLEGESRRYLLTLLETVRTRHDGDSATTRR